MSTKERRLHPRKEFMSAITFDVGAQERTVETAEAEILNVSAGGTCILTENAQEPGKVLRLKLPLQGTDIHVPSLAEVRWVVPDGNRYKMGLRFLL